MKRFTVRLAAVLTVLLTVQSVSAVRLLVPVGQVIGLEVAEDRVTVAGFDADLGAAAQKAGLRQGDQITHIDGQPICSPEDIRRALVRSDGDVDIRILRGSGEKNLEMDPAITPQGPKLGIYLRQGVTGVGTVTYYDPDTGSFGALGHGVSSQNGKPVTMTRGFAYRAAIDAINRGTAGAPGQLVGSVTHPVPMAILTRNTPQGVFGSAAEPFAGTALPAAEKSQIQTGPAVIRSTVDGSGVQEYSVEILKIYPHSDTSGRNMLLRVTDPRLLAATGGIVQGMSGSPILQDGKLVGAVTHVLVNDPTRGYGIFIENMLEAAE